LKIDPFGVLIIVISSRPWLDGQFNGNSQAHSLLDPESDPQSAMRFLTFIIAGRAALLFLSGCVG